MVMTDIEVKDGRKHYSLPIFNYLSLKWVSVNYIK